MKPKGAVVIGGHINGLGIIRSLAARKIPTGVILTKPYDLAQHSRHVSGFERAFEITEKPDQLLEALDRRSSQWRGWALFPVNDEALAALAQNRHQLELIHQVIAPPNETLDYFLDKKRMLDEAESVGMQTPLCYGPAVQATADRPDLRFPVIVKPIAGYRFVERFDRKVFVAANRAELKHAILRVEQEAVPCLVFDIIPGADSLIYCYCVYMDAEGNPVADITVRKVRQSPPFFGVSRVAEITANNQQLKDLTIAFLRRIGFRGIAVSEFKQDPRDGSFRLMEINGRSVMYNSLLRQAGMDLAALAWSDFVDRRAEGVRTHHWPGAWVHLHADLLYSILKGRSESLRLKDFLSPYRRPIVEAVWSFRDPLPFLVEWGRTACQGSRALCGKPIDPRIGKASFYPG